MWKRKDKTQDLPIQHQDHHHPKAELEILKAVAQAWLSRHETNNNASDSYSNEFGARRKSFLGQPSRFKIEALRGRNQGNESGPGYLNWDFNQSLWDPYEIVVVSKTLEQGLVFDHGFSGFFLEDEGKRGVLSVEKRKESKNSLRNLLNMVAGRRSV